MIGGKRILLAAVALLGVAAAAPARADWDEHDGDGWRWHRWHHWHPYYYAPPPVYYAPPPRVYYAPPRPHVYYAPPRYYGY